MTTTLTTATLPVFRMVLSNLAHVLDKAAASAEQRKFSPDVFVGVRLAPDMLPFAAQVRIACDSAKLGTARLGGLDAPKFADDETTFAELQARVAKTLAWLDTVPGDVFDGREQQDVTFPVGRDATRTMKGGDFMKHWVIPNVFFHAVTAYALLRHNGVSLGKLDYLLGPQVMG